MKKLTTLILLLLCVATLFAQAPEKFSYQAVVRNASNALVSNTQVGVRVNILQGSATGNAVYSESHVVTTNANGLVSVNIGGGSVLHGSFAGIDWSDGPYFLKTDIDPNGGNDYSITSAQQLLSVPYALYAKDAGNGFSGDYNDLVNVPQIPQIPADISAFNNDAGYITGYTETDPQYNAWDKDYNDLINKPTIPTVPTNVSAFTNDAGYITTQDIPTIPTVPTNVSAFTNDAGYLTTYTETDPQYNAWNKDYNDLINKPVIPVVPTNVSSFNNDAGYITAAQVPAQVNADWNATSGAALILNKPTLFSGNYNDLTNKPTLFDGNYNSLSNKPNLAVVATTGNYADLNNKPTLFDGDYNSLSNRPVLATVATTGNYNDLSNKPSIPTIPTNLSSFNNDAGYITANDVPAQVNADWNATAGAAQILNKPTIPTVPTNVSAFTNDAGYVTAADVQQAAGVPTNVSAFNNDMGYLTSYTETDPLFTTWGKNYNTLNNKPNLATVATTGSYNDLTNKPIIPTVPSNVSAFSNDAHYITEAQLNALFAAMNNTIDSLRDRIEELENNPSQPIPAQTLGSVTTSTMTYVGVNSAIGGGNVTSDGNGSILARGICWSTTNPPYVTDSHTNEGTAVGVFSSTASGLNPSTTYYVRAYVTNSVGTAYGSVVSFTTNSSGTPVLPTVTTGNVTNIAPYTATFHGNVVYNGGTALLARGFVYGLAHNPTLEDNFTVDGITEGAFSSTVTGLSANMTYYVRAYSTNSVGTVYGEEKSFVSSTTPPAVTTAEVTSISYTSATCGGDVPFSGGAAVTSKGLCYGLNEHPTISDNVVNGGAGVGSFTGNLTGLTANTVYYVRAFATNSVGTNYGEERVFSTLSYQIPTVEAVAPSDISYTTFTCGGNVTDEGSYPVTSRGVCWSTMPNPTINDNYVPLGTGTGTFTYTVFGLSPNTTYYVRAYAINQVGHAYSEQMIVSTLANTKPTVATLSASGLGKCIGNIVSTGGLAITDRGFCYSTYPNPTIVESHVSAGAGDGQFTAMLPNMVDNTTYYVRAYATNMLGTNYGQQKSFTYRCGGTYQVTDASENNYNTVRIGNQCWMAENLRTTKYADGTVIAPGSGTSSTVAYYYTPTGSFQRGYLYNWKAVMRDSPSSHANPSGVQGICPTGWHVPSDAEWAELEDTVSSHWACGSNNPTYIAKALAAQTEWNSSSNTCAVGNNLSANNATGFGALPAGYYGGSCYNSGGGAYFWSSTEASSGNAWYRYLGYSGASVYRNSDYKSNGYSVRCLRD
ncbi:MAG: fibrobacter succinogenes major paralogous domain-containing protein [Bacteroidales bacterium]|nr:fibrobacter succinogenes major paralogous domain-containing protein [Bacteroidales bacterium]